MSNWFSGIIEKVIEKVQVQFSEERKIEERVILPWEYPTSEIWKNNEEELKNSILSISKVKFYF
jgi:hypothetical protein